MDNVNNVKFPPELFDFEGWSQIKRILIILAHPDDPDYFCGASIARWTEVGHYVEYCLLTKGQKGIQNNDLKSNEISQIRMKEQECAADLLGVKKVEFLDYVDGEIIPDMKMKKEIVRIIRRSSPNIIVTSDPQNYFTENQRINHPDHRSAGQVVVDSLYPAAGNGLYFKDLIENEQLKPVNVEELWVTATNQPNLEIDMTSFFEKRFSAILCHRSQVGNDIPKIREHLWSRFKADSASEKKAYLEKFRRIKL
ncbi:MAG: PIG-L family deacetylase [Chloroflexi bacterium]|nr:PIG-L family deacetylase [Chloroflexota bacterium]